MPTRDEVFKGAAPLIRDLILKDQERTKEREAADRGGLDLEASLGTAVAS